MSSPTVTDPGQATVMSPPAPRPCGVAGCQYQTPENLTTHDLVLRDLELHVKMVQLIDIYYKYY